MVSILNCVLNFYKKATKIFIKEPPRFIHGVLVNHAVPQFSKENNHLVNQSSKVILIRRGPCKTFRIKIIQHTFERKINVFDRMAFTIKI